MLLDYKHEPFHHWQTIAGINFSRKLENETAFDDVVKIYSFQTDSDKVNDVLRGLYFGEFMQTTRRGLLLRQFIGKESWPHTLLVHLDLGDNVLRTIIDTNSSYLSWPVKFNGEKYTIYLSPDTKVEFADT